MFVLRVALGVMFIFPGIGKLMDFDKAVGAAAERGFWAPALFGALLLFAEFGGAILMILGSFVRPVALMQGFAMSVAFHKHLTQALAATDASVGSVWGSCYPQFLIVAICVAIFLGGAGALSLGPAGSKPVPCEASEPPPKDEGQ